MKKYNRKSLGDVISTAASMLLFLLFAVCLLLMIAVAAGTYSRISTNFDKTFGLSASLRYISNKIKSADSAEVAENGKGIRLTTGDSVDMIYFSNGELFEKNMDNGDDGFDGESIFELSDMSVSEADGLFKISITMNGESNITYVRGR